MIKRIMYTLKGAVIGAGGAACLYIAGIILNVGCAILTCNCSATSGFDWSGMWSLIFMGAIGGAVIGLIYGIYKTTEESNAEKKKREAENSGKAQEQRIQWANEIKKKALNVSETCELNSRNDLALVSEVYKADAQMELILSELANATEIKGKIDAIVEDVQKGGGSK